MKSLIKIFISINAAILLSACSSLPYDRESLLPMVSEVSKFSPDEVLFLAEANFAISPPDKTCAKFKRGAYVQTSDNILVYEYNRESQRLQQFHKISISDLDYVGIHSAGIGGFVNQLRFVDSRAWLTVAITRQKDIVAGSKKDITPAIDALEKNNIKVNKGAPVVTNNAACNFILYIPS